MFELPILVGFNDKTKLASEMPMASPTPQQLDIGAYAIAFAECTLQAERTMREAWPDEVSMIIAEDKEKVRSIIKETHSLWRNGPALIAANLALDYLPLEKIRDTVHFAKKQESRHLQLADACAFFIRGHLTNHPHNARFYDVLRPWMLAHPNESASVELSS
jgi:hypothetical protein